MTQAETADLLVARRWAERLPLGPRRLGEPWERCHKSISLLSLNACDCRGQPCRRGSPKIYVTEAGEILSGHTRREARRVGPQTRRRMLGED